MELEHEYSRKRINLRIARGENAPDKGDIFGGLSKLESYERGGKEIVER